MIKGKSEFCVPKNKDARGGDRAIYIHRWKDRQVDKRREKMEEDSFDSQIELGITDRQTDVKKNDRQRA